MTFASNNNDKALAKIETFFFRQKKKTGLNIVIRGFKATGELSV